MAEIKIFWTNTAVKQRNSIFEYWNERNNSTRYSKKLNTLIKERLKVLKTNPDIGKRTEFVNTRAISLGHYSIFYQIIESQIFIISFWDNRQDPVKLLIFLKNK